MHKVIDNIIGTELESAVRLIQEQALEEGNTSITPDKYDVKTSVGTPLLITCNSRYDKFDKIAGFCSYEPDTYMGTPDIAVRMCRLHILKEFRHNQLGFYFWDHCLKKAKEDGYKILYGTHDVNAKALNALYQHKRFVPGHSKEPYNLESWKSMKLETRFLFDVDPGSEFLQNVYYVDVNEDGYQWAPKTNVKWL
jgi:ribosomal protein S18 acetylase RimI-like enzyme|tara:strand:+ start:381 stop:965 length:585 start_codon:yes stop_codon:yes gene_type:complete